MDTAAGDINAPLTIISSKETGNGRIYFMGLKSIYAGSSDAQLDIYFDTRNNAYVIDSDKDILINADVRVNGSGDSNEYDDYSHVLTSDNSITAWGGVCSQVKWSMTKPVDYVYVTDDNVKTTDEIYWSTVTQSGNSRVWTFSLGEPSFTKYVTISVVRNAEHKADGESKQISYVFTANGQEYFPRTFESGSGRCFTTEEIFVPLVFQGVYPELQVTAPSEFYVIVKCDGVNVDDMAVDAEKEQQKRLEIQGQDDAETVITTTGGLYDPTRTYLLRYERVLTLKNEADTDAEMLKTAIVHIAGIACQGTKKDQKMMEYYVQLDSSVYPKAHSTLDVSLQSDYGLEDTQNDKDYRWEVSLIGNTEFFIDEQQ